VNGVFESFEDYCARDFHRCNVVMETRLQRGDDFEGFLIRNLSLSGFAGDSASMLPIGAIVGIELPSVGLVEAQIRWVMGTRCGALFSTPLSLEDCRRAVVPGGPGERPRDTAADLRG